MLSGYRTQKQWRQ